METKHLSAKEAYAFRSRKIIRLIIALAIGLTGIANMLFAILPSIDWSMLLGAWPLDTHHGLYKLTVVIGFFLLMLSYGLVRGKRGAWRVAFILLSLSAILHILSGGQVLVVVLWRWWLAWASSSFTLCTVYSLCMTSSKRR